MRWDTKRKRRIDKTKDQELEDLRAEKQKLEFIRDSQHVYDAVALYLTQTHLTAQEQAEIREAMRYLCRG